MRPPGSPEELERRRRRAIALLGAGQSPVEVARIMGVDRRSVRRWKAAHHRAGIRALRARRASGRPPKLAPSQLKQMEQILLNGAQAVGFPTDLWTCPRIAQVIARRFGVRYHVDHLSRLLRSLGWSPQKPQRQAMVTGTSPPPTWSRSCGSCNTSWTATWSSSGTDFKPTGRRRSRRSWHRHPASTRSSSHPTRPSSTRSNMRGAISKGIRWPTGRRRISSSWLRRPAVPAGLCNTAQISFAPSFVTARSFYAAHRTLVIQDLIACT